MTERKFPVLWPHMRKDIACFEALGCPRDVPWAFIAGCKDACERLHDQTPERLAERGGLAPTEMLAVRLHGWPTFPQIQACWYLPPEQAIPKLREAVAEWEAARAPAPSPPRESK